MPWSRSSAPSGTVGMPSSSPTSSLTAPSRHVCLPRRRAEPGDRRGRPAVELRRRRRDVPPRRRGEADRPRLPLRPVRRGHNIAGRAAAAPDHRRLRGDAAAPAAALPPRRRPWRRQDDHDRPVHPRAPRPGRPPALPHRRPGLARRAVAGRSSTRSSTSTFDILTRDRIESSRTGNPFDESDLLIARLDKLSPRRGPPAHARAARRTGTSSSSTRRTSSRATLAGDEVKKTKRRLLAERVRRTHPPLPAPDRDAAQRQGGGLPAVHEPARPRPLRGPPAHGQADGAPARLGPARPHAPADQGGARQVRRHAALPAALRRTSCRTTSPGPRPPSTSRSRPTSARR